MEGVGGRRGGGLTVDRHRDNEENQDAGERRESPASRGKARFPPLHGGLTVLVSGGGTDESKTGGRVRQKVF